MNANDATKNTLMGIVATLKGKQGQLKLWILISLALQLLWNLRYNNDLPSYDASLRETEVRGDVANTNAGAASLIHDSGNMPSENLMNDNENEKTTTIYGHLHMQKTGGSNTNGVMATKYDNVCGNKGSSYNAFTVNKERLETEKGLAGRNGVDYKNEVGFENCDYISIETNWQNWNQHIVKPLEFAKRNMKLELHVPCRDPVDHLLSLCNNRGKTFQCPDISDEEAIGYEIKNCLLLKHGKLRTSIRYDPKLKNESEHIQLKCYSAFPIEDYISYMGQYMRPRKIEAPFVDRKTNEDRNKSMECLLAQDENYRATVKRLILELEKFMGYYSFCEECMGSGDQLKLQSSL